MRSTDIRPGSLVAVTGVYSYQWGPPPSFRLFLRSADDVRVRVGGAVVDAAPHGRDDGHAGARRRRRGACGCGRPANRKRQEYQAVLNERSRVGRELHDTLEQGLAGIALQLEAVAGSLQLAGAAQRVARRGAADAALQPRRGAAICHGSALAGARKPRPRRRADGHGAADDASARRASPKCASKGRRTGSTRRTSITCCASASKR